MTLPWTNSGAPTGPAIYLGYRKFDDVVESPPPIFVSF